METLINLSKEVKIVLTKNKAPKIVAQVNAIFDTSGSAQNMYKTGIIQGLSNRLFAVGNEFDDNATLDAWAFDNYATALEPITEDKFGNYTDKYILNAGFHLWGGTEYAPPLRMMRDHYLSASAPGVPGVTVTEVKKAGFLGKLFGKKDTVEYTTSPSTPGTGVMPAGADPVYSMFVTDGDNQGEEDRAERQLEAMKNDPIFIMFIGITDHRSPGFAFLRRMAEKYSNVGFFDAGKVMDMPSQALFTEILNPKFISWYNQQRQGAQ